MGYIENQINLEKKNLKDSVDSNYSHGKCLIKLRNDFRSGKISGDDFRVKNIYHKSVIEEQNKWGVPLSNLEKKTLYLKAKNKVYGGK